MGRHSTPAIDSLVQLGYRNKAGAPVEDVADGCPGAWYRTPFVDSVLYKYQRERTEGGGRVDNPDFSAACWQIRRAVRYFEGEEERAIRFVNGIAADRLEARTTAQQSSQRGTPARVRRGGG
jgi:hypothetical protein